MTSIILKKGKAQFNARKGEITLMEHSTLDIIKNQKTTVHNTENSTKTIKVKGPYGSIVSEGGIMSNVF